MAHKARVAGFCIDCKDTDPSEGAAFWTKALGMPSMGREGDTYEPLDGSARDLAVEVQRVYHESRLHLDIESTDVEAEVTRLVGLGATRIEAIKTWVVLEAPTGHRFCVIRAKDLTKPGFVDYP